MISPSRQRTVFEFGCSRWETCSRLHRVGAQDGNPLQCYRSAEESTTARWAALAVVEHCPPGFESHRQQLHWPRPMAQIHAAALLHCDSMPSLPRPRHKEGELGEGPSLAISAMFCSKFADVFRLSVSMRKVAGEHPFCVLIHIHEFLYISSLFHLFILLPYLIFDFVCLTLSLADTHGIAKYARTYIRRYTRTRTHKNTKHKKNKMK